MRLVLINKDNLENNITKLKTLRQESNNDVIDEESLNLYQGYTNEEVYNLMCDYNTLKNQLLNLIDSTINFMEKTKNEYVAMDIGIAEIFKAYDK